MQMQPVHVEQPPPVEHGIEITAETPTDGFPNVWGEETKVGDWLIRVGPDEATDWVVYPRRYVTPVDHGPQGDPNV